MLVVIGIACTFAAGVWLLVATLWPPPARLSVALRRLHARGVQPSELLLMQHARARRLERDSSLASSVGHWVVRRVRVTMLADEQTASDLMLLDRPLEVFAGTTVLAAVGGMLVGPLLWATAAAAGTPLPIVFPLWFMVAGSLAGWFLPRATLRGEAARGRVDFRHALGAYLDVLVLLLAAHEGPESAMDLAASAGRGPAFAELREAVSQARLSGDAVWDRLDDLGRQLRIPELREIAAAGSLAGESGAAVRQSLTAKARALRSSALSSAETTARKKSQAMFAPLVLMGMGFILFLIYPLITNLSIGGT